MLCSILCVTKFSFWVVVFHSKFYISSSLNNIATIPLEQLTLIRTVFLANLIGTYVDKCQHAVFMFFNANAWCFEVYFFSSIDGHARLINLTAQSNDRAARSIDCMVNLNLIKHYNFKLFLK